MTGLALLELEKKVLKPTLVGDTIHNEVEVVGIKPTSRGNRAVVTTMNSIVNQRGETVIVYKAVRMMAGRAPDQAAVSKQKPETDPCRPIACPRPFSRSPRCRRSAT